LARRIRMQGFMIFDEYGHRYGEYFTQMGAWLSEGRITFRERHRRRARARAGRLPGPAGRPEFRQADLARRA
jgi:hypothetical protein